VELTPTEGSWLVDIEAPYHGDPAPASAPGTFESLWEYEVVEVFVAGDDGHYLEIELGPHGHHLVLQLDGVRRVARRGLPIDFETTIEAGRWRGRAIVPRDYLPTGPLRGNAFAMHGAAPDRRHLAAFPVGGARPDFHRLESYRALEIR
jgi:hypothetical protein